MSLETHRRGTRDVVCNLVDALWEAGLDPSHLDVADLAPLETLTGLGHTATAALARLARIGPGQTVLDAPAGIGAAAVFLAARGAKVVALDPHPSLCNAADQLVRGTGLTKRVDVICFESHEHPFPDRTFDVVWAQLARHTIPDRRGLFVELTRVIRPGGCLALLDVVTGPEALTADGVRGDGDVHGELLGVTELHSMLNELGLDLEHWEVGPRAIATLTADSGSTPTPRIDLRRLDAHHHRRVAAFRSSLAARRINPVIAVARRRR
jgi:sarcosine/dimethylglycine N-methyltransferase